MMTGMTASNLPSQDCLYDLLMMYCAINFKLCIVVHGCRSTFPGAGRYAGHWTGGIQQQLHHCLVASLLLLPFLEHAEMLLMICMFWSSIQTWYHMPLKPPNTSGGIFSIWLLYLRRHALAGGESVKLTCRFGSVYGVLCR
jgi:hypothetical protein